MTDKNLTLMGFKRVQYSVIKDLIDKGKEWKISPIMCELSSDGCLNSGIFSSQALNEIKLFTLVLGLNVYWCEKKLVNVLML